MRLSRTLAAVCPQRFFDTCQTEGIKFFSGVPDSLLKEFCAVVSSRSKSHVIAANEGSAVSLAAGHYLATGSVPLVYAQNSGFGNMVNPLLSLAHPKVYGIPMVLLLGWRGEPGVKDEPQHEVMGSRMQSGLDGFGIEWLELNSVSDEAAGESLQKAIDLAKQTSSPVALLVRKNAFASSDVVHKDTIDKPERMSREEVTRLTCAVLSNALFVASTGLLSRELYEIREHLYNGDHSRDFLCVGSMGHAGSIAAGIATESGECTVVCLEGDGALLMHMGSMAIIGGSLKPKNLVHICINNGLHESVGGQPTVGFQTDFCAIAKACGYSHVFKVTEGASLRKTLERCSSALEGPVFIEVRVKPGFRTNIGRPKTTPIQNKLSFMSSFANIDK